MSPLPESIKPSAARGAAQKAKFICDSPDMMIEAFAQIDKEEIDPLLSITTKAA